MAARRPLPPELRRAYDHLAKANRDAALAWGLRWADDPEGAERELTDLMRAQGEGGGG